MLLYMSRGGAAVPTGNGTDNNLSFQNQFVTGYNDSSPVAASTTFQNQFVPGYVESVYLSAQSFQNQFEAGFAAPGT